MQNVCSHKQSHITLSSRRQELIIDSLIMHFGLKTTDEQVYEAKHIFNDAKKLSALPFYGSCVHLLFVVEQTVGGAADRDGGIQTQRLCCGQNQLTLQLKFIIL